MFHELRTLCPLGASPQCQWQKSGASYDSTLRLTERLDTTGNIRDKYVRYEINIIEVPSRTILELHTKLLRTKAQGAVAEKNSRSPGATHSHTRDQPGEEIREFNNSCIVTSSV